MNHGQTSVGEASPLRSALHCSTVEIKPDEVVWKYAERHMWEAHRITPAEAREAMTDDARIVHDPDYNSKSRRTVRIIGMSATAAAVLTVLVLPEAERVVGINAWKSNSRDRRVYREGNRD
jgi:uncharacterized DUF497 family protein